MLAALPRFRWKTLSEATKVLPTLTTEVVPRKPFPVLRSLPVSLASTGMSAPRDPMEVANIQDEGGEEVVTEGQAKVTFPSAAEVFYNPGEAEQSGALLRLFPR